MAASVRPLPYLFLLLPLLGSAACGHHEAAVASESVKPGINKPFLEATDEDIQEFVGIFEGESREIFIARDNILAALELKPGQAIGDIGAGTGLFEPMFQERVGEGGKVYAVDISPKMIEHLEKRVQDEDLKQVEVVTCTETTTGLAAGSVDVLFICDTYHHFEYPTQTLASLYENLRPGGTLAVVDFERIEGVSRKWILNHMRAGKEVFRAEIEAAGFEFVAEPAIDGLDENYMLLFRRP